MSGHSKWHNIKHKKAASDAKKAKVYTKLIKEITISARSGGGDATSNAHLRSLLEKARAANMPLENAQRAIKRGTGELPGVSYEAQQYEGYGPGGIAVIVEMLTDNKNRAIAELRSVFTRKGGSVAETGAVNWMFEHLGVIRGTSATFNEDALLEILMDYDTKNINHDDEGIWTITCATSSLNDAKKALQTAGFIIEDAEPEWVAKDTLELAGDKEQAAIDFLSALEDLDDVQNVYTNLA